MKIGINLLLWTAHAGPAQHGLLREIKRAGYDGVEVPVFEGTVAEYQEFGHMLRDLGLEATALTVMDASANPISESPAVRQAARDRLHWVLERCHALGAGVLCGPLHSALGVFSGAPRTLDEWERAREFFHGIDSAGVELAIEYLNRFETYFLTTAAEAAAFASSLENPACGLMWDTFHAHIEEKSIPDALRAIAPHLIHVHISENDRGTPGAGQVDWAANFRTLREIGYDRWLVIEAFGRALPELAAATRVWRDFFADPRDVMEQGISFIREQLK